MMIFFLVISFETCLFLTLILIVSVWRLFLNEKIPYPGNNFLPATDFEKNISCHIKNDLVLIKDAIEIVLSDEKMDASLQKQLESIKVRTQRLQCFVEELIAPEGDFAELNLNIEEHDLVVFLRNEFSKFSHIRKENEMSITVKREIASIRIGFDALQMSIMINKLISAISQVGLKKINVKISKEQNRVCIRIVVDGEVQEKFEAISAIDQKNYADSLELARNVVERHNGYFETDTVLPSPFENFFKTISIFLDLISVQGEISVIQNNSQFLKETDEFSVDSLNSCQSECVADEFLIELESKIKENIANPLFGIKHLCKEIGMSRSALYRKVKTLTNISIHEFCKDVRLKYAAELLASGNYKVNEVCELVGLTDRKYFSKQFKERYGRTPIEHINSNKSIRNRAIISDGTSSSSLTG